MNHNPTKPERIGDLIGQKLAERFVDIMRPGGIIVDNRATPVHLDRYRGDASDEKMPYPRIDRRS